MVKPDPKVNYYAALELPATASVDDVRKAYRKLALQYHPDRNAGKEEECVPRFQAIQAAHEVLSDPTIKAKYDADRRKAGLYPAGAYKPSVPTPGNPYAARSDFPPPPRRTQPGTYQRPNPTPTGADRFTNFPRPGGAAPRKDPGADRAQQFRAWQNMNNPERPRHPPQPPPREPQPAKSPQPNVPNRPRTQRQDTKLPTEEQIRAGMRHGKTATSGVDEDMTSRQSAWAGFQKANAGQPGMARKPVRPPATPRRTGFDPSAPGSDERPASGHYVHRHKSEDFTAGGFPPPPPGPPPTTTAPSSPASPGMQQRPFADPLRPFRSRNSNDDVPFTEANRTSTPYGSYIGEKTMFNSDGLRRSASTRDATKLSPETARPGHSRARSVDPTARAANEPPPNGSSSRPTFSTDFSSSEVSDGSTDYTTTPDSTDNNAPKPGRKFAVPRSKRTNGSAAGVSPAPTNGIPPTDTEQPSMQQTGTANMYDTPSTFAQSSSFSSPFCAGTWISNAFGPRSIAKNQARKPSVPKWAIPSSVFPSHSKDGCRATPVVVDSKAAPSAEAHPDEVKAFNHFRSRLTRLRGNVEQLNLLDLETFRQCVVHVRRGTLTGVEDVDECLCEVLHQYPSVGYPQSPKKFADATSSSNSFTFPIDGDTFNTTRGKSRSVEAINTNFSPEGWSGKFQGSGDYFASDANSRKASPGVRGGSSRGGMRANTTDTTPGSKVASPLPPPQGPLDRDDLRPSATYESPTEATFDPQKWTEALRDPSWANVPPPPPNPPGSKAPSRKGSRLASKTSGPVLGTEAQPHVVDDDDDVVEVDRAGKPVNGFAVSDDGDAMDIDTPPRPSETAEQAKPLSSTSKEPRLYAVPPSQWRKDQAQVLPHHRQTSSSSRRTQRSSGEPTLKTNLDDLTQTAPFAPSADGLKNLADLSATLPYASKASSTLPTHPVEPKDLQLPSIPAVPNPPQRFTKANWQDYTQKFSIYLLGYHIWNEKMLNHFTQRQKDGKALAFSGKEWLSANGDPVSTPMGFGHYCKAAKEDEKVREAWNIGCERHLDAVKAFEGMRDQVKGMAEKGVLMDI